MTDSLPLSTEEGYDRWSKVYDTDENPLVALEEDVVHRWFGDPAGRHVADVGCGTGRHSVWLADRGARVDAFDGSSKMLGKARGKDSAGAVRFTKHRLPQALPVEDATYDAVVFALVADHVAELEKVFSDLRRVTKPKGMIAFTVLHPAMNLKGVTARFLDPDSGERVHIHAYEYTYGDYVTAVLRAGLEITEIVERAADAELAARKPRAERYLGWPMLLAMKLTR